MVEFNFETNPSPTCIRCGHGLTEVPIEEMHSCEDYSKEYICPNCGAYHTASFDDDDNMDYPAFKGESPIYSPHGYDGECPICGNSIIWQSDFMRSEVWGDVDEEEKDEYGCPKDDSLATYVSCPHCGALIEIVDAKPSEISKYPKQNTNEED